MPCTYTGSIEGDQILSLNEALGGTRTSLTKVTQMLCATCENLEKAKKLDLLPSATRKWWEEHKKQDAERKKKK